MIKRYSTEDMTRIWSDQNKFNTWKIVELAVRNTIEGLPIKNNEALINPEILREYKNLKELKY